MLSVCGNGGTVGTELIGKEPDGEGSTDAMGAFGCFRISLCGVRVRVCTSFFSTNFVECCSAETGGIGCNRDSKTVKKPNEIT